MSREVIIVATAYDEKYYINDKYGNLPKAVIEDLIKISVTFVEDVGGIFKIGFEENGEVFLEVEIAEEDILYDHIGSGLNIKRIQNEYEELFSSLTLWYQYNNKYN